MYFTVGVRSFFGQKSTFCFHLPFCMQEKVPQPLELHKNLIFIFIFFKVE